MRNRHLCLLGDANSVHVRRWAAEMQARNFRVSLVTARPQAMEGVEQRVLSPVKRSTDWLLRVAEVRKHINELAPDIVHAHYVTSYGYLGARCGRHPLIMTAWGSDILVSPRASRLIHWLTRWTLRRADLITGDSRDLVAAIEKYAPRAPVKQVHWGADMARFKPAPWAEKIGFQVASLRAWEPNYRIDQIVGGVASFRQRNPQVPVHLHLLGGGTQEAELQAQVRSLGLAGSVTFHGRVNDAEMTAVLDKCKVSLSLPFSDATSVSVLESMACGLPVIASDLPANRQWISADDGLLVSDVKPSAVAAALEPLWLNDARAQSIGRANLERMQRNGSRSIQMDEMAALYTLVLKNAAESDAANG